MSSNLARFTHGSQSLPSLHLVAVMLTGALSVAADVSGQPWSNAQRLNDAGESAQGAIKKPEVCRAAGGGFHLVYRLHMSSGGAVPIKYRRYFNQNLTSVITAAAVPNYAWDEYVCEAGNGDIHVSWENWDATPNVGWTKSTNGGASFLPYIELTSFSNSAKAPRIAPVGSASGPDVMLVVANPTNGGMYYNRYNGSSWAGATSTGFGYSSEYQIFGICRSPVDGSIYAGNDDGSSTPALLHYTSFWSSGDIENTGFFARQSVAVDNAGEVMMCWEVNSVWYSKLYSPTSGWGRDADRSHQRRLRLGDRDSRHDELLYRLCAGKLAAADSRKDVVRRRVGRRRGRVPGSG